jgi:tRNA threonylcarbamoyl adenosine modification protein (Sua5/YciO/YrdC/YwlC family)
MADTHIIRATDESWLLSVQKVIQAGGLVAFPTDTVYGLGCDPFNASALQRLYKAKKRTTEKALPVLIPSLADLDKVAINISPEILNIGRAFWPGPLTIVLEKHPDLPDAISPEPTIGIRIPAHPVALDILKTCGPLAVSSANTSGGLDATTPQKVLEQLTGRIHLLIDGGPSLGNKPSTVMDGTRKIVRILREGPIGISNILASQEGTE